MLCGLQFVIPIFEVHLLIILASLYDEPKVVINAVLVSKLISRINNAYRRVLSCSIILLQKFSYLVACMDNR